MFMFTIEMEDGREAPQKSSIVYSISRIDIHCILYILNRYILHIVYLEKIYILYIEFIVYLKMLRFGLVEVFSWDS